MEFKNVVSEWKECRASIARFDGYLLRLRILGFSVFALVFTLISGLSGRTAEDSTPNLASLLSSLLFGKKEESPAYQTEWPLFALLVLSLFVLSIYVLDRYYERMLHVAVLRAIRLEAHRWEGFRIGLTTEIEFQKEHLYKKALNRKKFHPKRLKRFFSSASLMVNLVYFIIFVILAVQYILLLNLSKSSSLFSVIGPIFLLACAVTIYMSNKQLKEPMQSIHRRSEIVQAPVILSREEIQWIVKSIARQISSWLAEKKVTTLHTVIVLIGARPFAHDLLVELKRLIPRLELHLHFMHIDKKDIVCGCLNKERIENETVLIIDDLLDSGKTLSKVRSLVSECHPREIKVAVMIKKYDYTMIEPDFICMNLNLNRQKLLTEKDVKDYWLFG